MKYRIFINVIISTLLIVFLSKCEKDNEMVIGDRVTDIDGNVYKTVVIGDQVWMAENLRTTSFRNGDKISNIKSDSMWINIKSAAYCNYNNSIDLDTIKFGCLYNLDAVYDSRNIAPEGWHIPDTTEWNELINFLGGKDIAGGKMKMEGFDFWFEPNESATNESGFNGLPIGSRSPINGVFNPNGAYGIWWAKPFGTLSSGYVYDLSYDKGSIGFGHNDLSTGYTIRCIKD